MARLTGWKEIGSHLGKSVRTAQRWEQEYGLPVQRLGHEGGEIVWAESHELDDWLRTQSPRKLKTAQDDADPPPLAVSPITGTDHPKWRLTRPMLLGAGLVLLLSTVLLSNAWRRQSVQGPVGWRVEAGVLRALGNDGDVLWTAKFPVLLNSEAYASQTSGKSGSKIVQYDLDDDGRVETLVAAVGDRRSPDAAFHVFGPDGRERFPTVRPQHTVTFGDMSYAGPWAPYKIFVTSTSSGESRIHVTFIHSHEFPTLLLTLDVFGKVLGEYWSNGYIESVATGNRGGIPVWLVGATNNDSRGASLAIFSDTPQGSAPAAQPDYRCTSCAPGVPSEFLVIPRRCMAELSIVNGQAIIDLAYTDDTGRVFVYVREGPLDADGRPQSDVIYSFDSATSQADALVAAGLLTHHRNLERSGVLDHAWSVAEEATLFPVKRWNGTQFVEVPRGRVMY